MFFYLYDAFVMNAKHEGTLARVESRIIELGINGRVEKLTPLRNLKSLLEIGLKQGAHTIVVVGDDSTLLRTINIIATHNVVLGYIPFAEESRLAKLFGIPDTLEACNILSRRIIKTIDLGKANQNYFLLSLVADQLAGLRVRCDDSYTVSTKVISGAVRIHNVGTDTVYPANKRELILELMTRKQQRRWLQKTDVVEHTLLRPQRIILEHTDHSLPVTLDGEVTLKTPITVTLKPKQLRVIVGKNRLLH